MEELIESNDRDFGEVVGIIRNHQTRACSTVNHELIYMAWHVGGYISAKLKSEEWGKKVVAQLSEHIRTNYPDLKGYSRRNIYNMVMFYDAYSSKSFLETLRTYAPNVAVTEPIEIVQIESAQLGAKEISAFPQFAEFPKVLGLTVLSNLVVIICRCDTNEERLFYILHCNKERLTHRELRRCIDTQTYYTLLGGKEHMSQKLIDIYPTAPVLFKDTLFVDFLNLPAKHTEKKLKDGILGHMKQFVLELGKDFLFMEQEYKLEVGSSTYKADLLFYHRGLQALVAIELKKRKFDPRDLGQLEFYLEALDRDVKRSNENPSIGIILCPDADNVVVEYAMSRSMSPTLVSKYKQLLMPKEKMQKLFCEYCYASKII